MKTQSSEPVILLVEDNPGDIRLIEEKFSEDKIPHSLHTVTDGEDALDFIYQRGEYEGVPRPDIVLLDLNLPKVDGEDVLHKIKHHPDLEDVPVIVLAGVSEDIIESRDLDHDADEDGVLEKPIDPDEFVELAQSLENFQLSVVRED